jgi:protein-S-isoprenylcysteine O-methyltransferase Ste14
MMTESDTRFWSLIVVQLLSVALLASIIVFAPGPWDVLRRTGTGLALLSLIFLIISRYKLGSSFSVTPQAKALVTGGIYRRIRNPIYVFSALMVAGVF